MPKHTLAIDPVTAGAGSHDPSAAIFRDGQLVFGVEEERYTRNKHAENTFPRNAINSCLDYCGIELPEVESVLIPWKPKQTGKHDFKLAFRNPTLAEKAYDGVHSLLTYTTALRKLKNRLRSIGEPVPTIKFYNHHLTHAASAFHPSGFEQAVVLTIDGRGEADSTVVWKGNKDGLQQVATYEMPNSLGAFYAHITEFLGYRANNGEGKIMGLAPYGKRDPEIENGLLSLIDTGVDYDVTALVEGGPRHALSKLEDTFGREPRSKAGEFSDWEQDFAFVAQSLTEEIVMDIVKEYVGQLGIHNVALSGGVALNCKMNKRIMEMDCVNEIFIQPVAHDAGTAVGAGMAENDVAETEDMSTVYWGPEFSTTEIKETLSECKLDFREPDHIEKEVAEKLADGELVGWFQGRLEMGPRALGNRSILADPRTVESRDRVNEFVKHREEWRPFAPSMLEEAAYDYLENAEPSPYMIKTFDVKDEKTDELQAVLHPADDTTRPQTVREEQNPRYYRIIREFGNITGVPVVLNTSFNDHGEPIVTKPQEAIKDFYGMGLDILAIGDVIVEK